MMSQGGVPWALVMPATLISREAGRNMAHVPLLQAATRESQSGPTAVTRVEAG
jgi:hypothetical protein